MQIPSFDHQLFMAFISNRYDIFSEEPSEFRTAVVPVYKSSPSGNYPHHVGSATLATINDVKLLITATHVLDHNTVGDSHGPSTLYLGGQGPLVPFEEQGYSLSVQYKERDVADVTFFPLSALAISRFKKCSFIPEDRFSKSIFKSADVMYAAAGYPCSLNKTVNTATKKLNPNFRTIANYHNPNAKCKVNYPTDAYIFIPYHARRSLNVQGKRTSSFKATGLSGGPIYSIAELKETNGQLGLFKKKCQVEAIGIEWTDQHSKHTHIVGIQSAAILPRIKEKLDELGLSIALDSGIRSA